MDTWFTVESIDENTWAISEYRHWEETHCYLLCGTESALLIDTGLGIGDLGETVRNLTGLPVLAAVTHAHWDHMGGLRFFDRIAVHEAEEKWMAGKFPLTDEAVRKALRGRPCCFPRDFEADQYQVFQGTPQIILTDGMTLNLGNRTVSVLHTPGHSPGHCCFYEADRGYLFTGDLIYSGCLDIFYPSTDPVRFWESVKRMQKLEVQRILPGHHRLDISADMVGKVEAGLNCLAADGKLKHGAGLFNFEEFQIHV